MGAVMIRCPRTGRAVSTEIETEPGDFSRLPDVAGPDALLAVRRGARLDRPRSLAGRAERWFQSR